MKDSRFEQCITIIDNKNSQDPNKETMNGLETPKELLYSRRMTKKLLEFKPEASEALQLAARAQHICRWKIPRGKYPKNKIGYIKWREELKNMHANLTQEILRDVGYNSNFIQSVSNLIRKKSIKKNEETQALEDTICLVFLEYYFEDFAIGHPDEKVIDILRKTWRKMSLRGQKEALKLQLSPRAGTLLDQAMAGS